jgi:hypothetical protein
MIGPMTPDSPAAPAFSEGAAPDPDVLLIPVEVDPLDREPGVLSSVRVKLDELTPYPGNPRRGNPQLIAESLRANTQYRPLVVQASTMTVLAGNHTLIAARELGWETVEVTLLDVDDEQARRIVLADNRTSDVAETDDAALLALLEQVDDLEGTGFTAGDLAALLAAGEENIYTAKVAPVQYEVVGPCPDVVELTDDAHARDLRAAITATQLPDDVAEFLTAATWRHVVFDYRRIAEFYPHQTPEVQALMEQSALVIIDVDDAIQHGYMIFTETMQDLMGLADEPDA